jgi:M6 family metalloprotease-like protein
VPLTGVLLSLLALQGAPLEQERERLRSRAPLTGDEKKAYAAPEAPPFRPLKPYSLCVIPLSFSDAAFGETDLRKLFFERLADYGRRASGGRFELIGRAYAPVRIEVSRAGFAAKDLEAAAVAFLAREGEGALAPFDGAAFVAPGGLGTRGSALWPRKDSMRLGERTLEYVFLTETADGREVGIAAHEFMHLLGLEDKYDDEKAQVGRWCIMGTGYVARDPAPPCADCREKLGWARPASLDPRRESAVVLAPDAARPLKILLNPDATEHLLLEVRDRLVVWHVGGGQKIELSGRFPSETSDRLTPFSDPPFRGRSAGSWPVWITDVRVEDGKAWFRVGPSAPLTPLEEWRRSRAGKRIGE